MKDKTDVRVTHEPLTYSPTSPWSFFRDHVAYASVRDREAGRRLGNHAREMVHELQQSSAQGLAARAQIRESYREHSDGEKRMDADLLSAYEGRAASTTGVTSLGAFVTPVYLDAQWAEYSGENSVYTDQTMKLPLPDYGMVIHVPAFSAPGSAGFVIENATVPNVDPVTLDRTATLSAVSTEVDISQQMNDRAFSSGGSYDAIVGLQLREQLNEAVNRRILQRVFAISPTVPASGSTYSNAVFYQDVSALRESVKDAPGVKAHPTHLFTTYDLYNFVSRQTDATTGRPLMVPSSWPYPKPNIGTDQDDRDWGFTGTVLPGPLFWYFDDCIPSNGSNTQLLVSRPDKTLTWIGTPALRVFPQTVAGSLKVVIQLYTYVTSMSRFDGANATLSSAAYPLTAK